MPVPEERVIREGFTEEFLREFAGVEDEKARELLEEAAARIERSFEAVAWVGSPQRTSNEYTIRVIPKQEAERREIKHGVRAIYDWLGEDNA